MADNTRIKPDSGAGTIVVWTDDVSGVHVPGFKLVLGAMDADDGPVSATNPMPADVTALATFATSQETVTGTSGQIVASGLAGRRTISLKAHPDNTATIWISSVTPATDANSFPLDASESVEIDLSPGQAIYAIADSGSQTLCVMEVSP
ncbi:MAG: hypothetical protein A3E01_02695 [Gammaproteobacteria bacterium RIFCSPHIGHO2_12_FULL_63_22]|nr:MAG: hypothetical protein A3E01_02695 [Gammaproteobacteria bacterium RIFCSPHIGHO2_12_FULL_63_22]